MARTMGRKRNERLGRARAVLALLLTGIAAAGYVSRTFAVPVYPSAAATDVQPAEPTPAQLQQLVAPIALYPDELVAQVLAASTYPEQVVEADRWLQQHDAAAAIVARMKAGLETARPSVGTVEFVVSADRDSSRLIVGVARKRVDGAARVLFVVLAPDELAGTAYLVREGTGAENVRSVYLPAVRRVRTLVSAEAYTPFLNSDFTYADLGFVGTGTRYTFLRAADRDGVGVDEIQGIPDAWYYARTVTWVGQDTGLPVARDLFDPSNRLWKRERWEQVSEVDGVPTTLHVSMEDVQAKTRTDIDVRSIKYAVDVPDALFDPANLPSARTSPVWGLPVR